MKLTPSARLYLYLLIATADLLIIHQILQRLLDISIPFLDNYLDPFLSIPFLLSGFVLERRLLFKMRDFQLELSEIIFTTIALSLLFEFVFPYLFPVFVYDIYDFLAYAAGAILFYAISVYADRRIHI